MSWQPEFAAAFTPASSRQARLDDLAVSVGAAITAHARNVGFTPVITPGLAAPTRHRISHVDQNYLRPETYAAANAPLITAQAVSLSRLVVSEPHAIRCT
ncbi:MAG: Tn3 family transposase [Pseudonocardia sp.]|nr:Tn3 family transposase [Pseudonocardia sp.]